MERLAHSWPPVPTGFASAVSIRRCGFGLSNLDLALFGCVAPGTL